MAAADQVHDDGRSTLIETTAEAPTVDRGGDRGLRRRRLLVALVLVLAAFVVLLGVLVLLVQAWLSGDDDRQPEIPGAAPTSESSPTPEPSPTPTPTPTPTTTPATPPTVLWSGSFDPPDDSSWQEEAGVVVASRTNTEVVEEGPEGRDDVLKITFEEDSRWGADYRHSFEAMGVEPRTEVYFSYDIYFEPGFEFIGDGKFGGLAGISEDTDPLETSAGGDYDEDSFSVRAMWREDRSVVMYLYARHGNGKDIDDRRNYGYGITSRFRNPDGSTEDVLEAGRWYRIEHRVVLNTPGVDDGIYEMWIDGHKGVSVDDVQYRTDEYPDLRINQVMSAYFFGGGSDEFPTRDNVAYTDDWALTDGWRGMGP